MSSIKYVTNDSRDVVTDSSDFSINAVELDFTTLTANKLVFIDRVTGLNYRLNRDFINNTVTLIPV